MEKPKFRRNQLVGCYEYFGKITQVALSKYGEHEYLLDNDSWRTEHELRHLTARDVGPEWVRRKKEAK